MDRKLTVLADGTAFAGECRFHLSGKMEIGLFPSLFLLQCWNLSDADLFRLRNTKELSVYRDDSCLAFGKVSDVFRETVTEGTITTVAFSLGLDLWEAQVSVSVPAGASASETIQFLLNASGTGIQLLSFPGEDSVFSRGQAFCGRAAECIATALTAARAKGYLVPAGLCIVPAEPLEPDKDRPDRCPDDRRRGKENDPVHERNRIPAGGRDDAGSRRGKLARPDPGTDGGNGYILRRLENAANRTAALMGDNHV